MHEANVDFYALAAQVIPVFLLAELARVVYVREETHDYDDDKLSWLLRGILVVILFIEALALCVALLVVLDPQQASNLTRSFVIYGTITGVGGFVEQLLRSLIKTVDAAWHVVRLILLLYALPIAAILIVYRP